MGIVMYSGDGGDGGEMIDAISKELSFLAGVAIGTGLVTHGRSQLVHRIHNAVDNKEPPKAVAQPDDGQGQAEVPAAPQDGGLVGDPQRAAAQPDDGQGQAEVLAAPEGEG